jgi:hypothetical protein
MKTEVFNNEIQYKIITSESQSQQYTPDIINSLQSNEIFVFGANLAGRHGAGAAKTALKWGAVYGKIGLEGQTYGLPTKDENIETLPLSEIRKHVRDYIEVVKQNPDFNFLTTKIGCGLAGLQPSDIAPMFEEFKDLKNLVLPREFWEFYKNERERSCF